MIIEMKVSTSMILEPTKRISTCRSFIYLGEVNFFFFSFLFFPFPYHFHLFILFHPTTFVCLRYIDIPVIYIYLI